MHACTNDFTATLSVETIPQQHLEPLAFYPRIRCQIARIYPTLPCFIQTRTPSTILQLSTKQATCVQKHFIDLAKASMEALSEDKDTAAPGSEEDLDDHAFIGI